MQKSTYKTLGLWCLLALIGTVLYGQPPGWTAPTGMSNNMSITARVYLDGTAQDGMGNRLAAFVGSEIRGAATPQLVGGAAYYFLTVHSNAVIGETVTFKVYHAASDAILPALEEVPFVKNSNVGQYLNGFPINVSSTNDFPISLLHQPPDTTLSGYPFAGVALGGLLVSPDGDPVSWSASNSANLAVGINGSNVLTVTPTDPNWTGTDSVQVTATEQGTPNSYSAYRYLTFTVLADYGVPIFSDLPLGFVQGSLPSPSGNLGEYLEYNGPCLDYYFEMPTPIGDNSLPNWQQPAGNSGSMSITVEVVFGGNPFTGMDNKLAAFVDGQLAGVISPQVVLGRVLYFISLSNVADGDISFKFYHSEGHFLYHVQGGMQFEPAASVGDAVTPFLLDVAPITVKLLDDGTWTTEILNPSFSGQLGITFFAVDCGYPDKIDSTTTTFLFNQCPSTSVSLLGWGLCLKADNVSSSIVWYRNGSVVGNGQYFTALENGNYHYEGLTPTGCPNIKSCPVSVTNIQGLAPPAYAPPVFPSTWPIPPSCGSSMFAKPLISAYPCCPPDNIIFVDTNTPNDLHGYTWNGAFPTIQKAQALAARCPNTLEVWVAEGTYFPTAGADRSASFSLSDSLAIYGGFEGTETTLSQRDWAANTTTLSGDISTVGDSTDNSYHVVKNAGNNASAVLDGFTITGGNANKLLTHTTGAGMFNDGASPSIRNCFFTKNNALSKGGGMYNDGSSPNLLNCSFSGNGAANGGAISNEFGSSPVVDTCIFTANRATSNGGAVFNNSSAPSFTGCLFTGNTAGGSGGATASIFSSTPVLLGCQLVGNSAGSFGGASYLAGASVPKLENCIMRGNSASLGGGLFCTSSSNATAINSTFHANSAQHGGAVYSQSATPVLKNCILWGDTASAEITGTATVTYSIVQGGHAGTGNLDADPMFLSATDLRTSTCSPAVDAGTNSAPTSPVDILGNARTIASWGTSTVDMGAYEIQGDLTMPCTWTGGGDAILWSDPHNWSDLFLPQKCRDVVIPMGNSVVVPSGHEALGKTLYVELGGEVVTEPSATVDIDP